MSDTYTKLFSSITESTVWGEPYATRIVWVAMLAMADQAGNVYGSVPGLARRANVSLQEVEVALASFMSPDPYSRTKDEDGRRVEEIDGGWRLINHAKYRSIRGADERREAKRRWDRENRPSGHKRAAGQSDTQEQSDDSPTGNAQSDDSPTNPLSPAPPAPAPAPVEKLSLVQPAARLPSRFDEFWAEYPVKKGKAAAESAWQRKRLDAIADRIIADVKARKQRDRQWRDGFAPHGSTYVNQRGWEDDIEDVGGPRKGLNAADDAWAVAQ